MDYVNVVFHAPLWHVSDITVTFACLANSNYGCSSSWAACTRVHTLRNAQTCRHSSTGRLTPHSKQMLSPSILIFFEGINILKK